MVTTDRMIRLVDPAAETDAAQSVIATRLPSLKGARIGIVNNSKHMADAYLEATCRLLESQYGVVAFEHYRKFNPSVPTPPDVVDDMARTCDAVIHGVAD